MPDGVQRVPGGLWIGSACTPGGLVVDWLLGRSTQLGLRALSRRSDPPRLPELDWERWRESVVSDSAKPELWAVGLPRDRRRRRFQLFIPGSDGRPFAFAKFSRNPHSDLMLEVRHRLEVVTPETFTTPRPITDGKIEGWWYSVDLALPQGLHRPAALSSKGRWHLVHEIQEIFADLVSPQDRLVHGDFGPWNVRHDRERAIVVLDWEDVTPGPEAADELWHGLNHALIRWASRRNAASAVKRSLHHHGEDALVAAASFWLQRLSRPEAPEVDETVQLDARGKDLVAHQRLVLQQLAGK